MFTVANGLNFLRSYSDHWLGIHPLPVDRVAIDREFLKSDLDGIKTWYRILGSLHISDSFFLGNEVWRQRK